MTGPEVPSEFSIVEIPEAPQGLEMVLGPGPELGLELAPLVLVY